VIKYIQCKVCGHTTNHFDPREACLSEPAENVDQGPGREPISLGPWIGCSMWAHDVEGLYKYKRALARLAEIRGGVNKEYYVQA